MVKGVVVNIHVTVATGLPKDTQIGEPVLKRERVSNPHDAVVVGTGSFPPHSSPCLSASLEDRSFLPTGPHRSFNPGKGHPASRGLSHIPFLNPASRLEGRGGEGHRSLRGIFEAPTKGPAPAHGPRRAQSTTRPLAESGPCPGETSRLCPGFPRVSSSPV